MKDENEKIKVMMEGEKEDAFQHQAHDNSEVLQMPGESLEETSDRKRYMVEDSVNGTIDRIDLGTIEEKYRTIFENYAIAITVVDNNECVVSWNTYAEELLGMDQNDLFMRPVKTLYPPEEWEKVRKENVRNKGIKYRMETKMIKKNEQRTFDVEVSLCVLKGEKGNIIGSIGIIKDITKQKEMERAFKKSEEKFKQLYEKAPVPYHTLSPDGTITDVNDTWCQTLGYGKDEVIGKSIFDFIEASERETAKVSFEKKIQSKQLYSVANERTYLTKTNERRIFVIRDYFSFDNGHNIHEVYTIMDDVTELKKVEKELKKHEAIQTISQRLQTIIDKIEDGITLSDTKGKFELFNSRMQEITGYTMEEANRSSNFTTLLYPDVQEQKKALDTINETTKKGFSRNIETKIQAKDGTKKTLLVSTSLQNFDNRDMFLSVYRDITERKKAEEILKESESKHRTLLRNLPQEIFYKDKNSVYISCNESYASDLKIKPEDIPGKTDYDFFPKNLAEKYRDDDKRVLESGVTKDIEEFYTKDGKTLWVHTVKSPVKDTNGNIMGVLGIFWDITEQKTMQEAIKQSEERYRAIFESANDGIITMSKDGKINDINAIASTLFGYRREEFIGKNLKEIMHIFTLKSKMTILKNFALRILGKEIAPYDVEMIKADGSILNVEINAVPLRKDGAIVGDLAILHDVTDRKKAEDELKRKIEELERYKNVTVGRELTMVELKKEINELCEKLGEKPRYSLNRETL